MAATMNMSRVVADAETLDAVRPEVRRMLLQAPAFAKLTPAEQLEIANRTVKVSAYLANPGGVLTDLAGELGHGQQQWLELALALAYRPKLLLLDEPTGGMSPEERRVTGELLRPIRSECALVIVEHDIDFIKNLCDRLTVLDQGRVLDEGSVEQIEHSTKVQEVYTSRV